MYEDLILITSPFIEQQVGFTTVPLKALTDQESII